MTGLSETADMQHWKSFLAGSDYYTRLKKQANAKGFPDAVTLASTQTEQSLECKIVPENLSWLCAIVGDTLVPKFKHII